jgi:hypothetical protein
VPRKVATFAVSRRTELPPTGHRPRNGSVFVDREPTGLRADTVKVDDISSAATAVGHLADIGHRRIAHLGDRARIQTARERKDGYLRAMAARGLPVDEGLIILDISDELNAYAVARRLLESPDPPTDGALENTVGITRWRVFGHDWPTLPSIPNRRAGPRLTIQSYRSPSRKHGCDCAVILCRTTSASSAVNLRTAGRPSFRAVTSAEPTITPSA